MCLRVWPIFFVDVDSNGYSHKLSATFQHCIHMEYWISSLLVLEEGLEPSRNVFHKILNLACLPIPPSKHRSPGGYGLYLSKGKPLYCNGGFCTLYGTGIRSAVCWVRSRNPHPHIGIVACTRRRALLYHITTGPQLRITHFIPLWCNI